MEKREVLKNAIWIIVPRIIQALLNLIISMFTARFLGPSNFGLINYAASLVAFLLPIMQLGITSIVVQEIINSPDDEGKILGTSCISSFISAILSIIGLTIFLTIFNYGEVETLIVTLIYSTLLLFSAFEIINYWFQAKLLSKYTSIVSLIAYTIVSAYKIFLLISQKNVYWFAASQSIDVLIIVVINMIIYKKVGGQKLLFSFETLKRLLNKSKYYIVSGLMISIFSQTDKIMLKIMVGDESIGLYSAAATCATMSGFVFAAIIDSMRPLILESKKESDLDFNKNIIFLYSMVIYLSLIQAIIFSVIPGIFIKILYGNDYLLSSNTLRILSWYIPFSYIGVVRNIWIISNNMDKNVIKIDVSSAILNIILNLIFIPLWGIEGAAIATLLTQIFSNIIMIYIIKDCRPNISLVIKALNPRSLYFGIKQLLKK